MDNNYLNQPNPSLQPPSTPQGVPQPQSQAPLQAHAQPPGADQPGQPPLSAADGAAKNEPTDAQALEEGSKDVKDARNHLDEVLARHGHAPAAEEDAALLELGPEFRLEQDAQPIFLAEVAHLLRRQVQGKAQFGVSQINPVLKKSLEYADRFGNIARAEDAIAIRGQLMAVPGIHPFEVAQIASLLPKDAEEAKAIIPSLKDRYEDDELNEMIVNLDVWL